MTPVASGPVTSATPASPAPVDPSRSPWALAGYAFLILFLELALIRYVSAYVRVFGFYLNLVLIATFLGMGVGLLRAKLADRLAWIFLPALPLLLGAVLFFSNVIVQPRSDANEYLWAIYNELAPNVRQIGVTPTVLLLFALSAGVMVPLGALMGREFRKWPPLVAYSLDIAGSLAGIAAFGVMSASRTTPLLWFATAYAVWMLLSLARRRFLLGVAATAVPALLLVTRTGATSGEFWSPYYRIDVVPRGPWISLHVNGSMHQWIVDFEKRETYGGTRFIAEAYDRPLRLAPRLDTVLIVGSGTGNDVRNLLALGAKHIDAVEIDPVILDLGRSLHPQEPYADPRVHAVVNDARAFLRQTRRRYDVIVFGTLDSQTLLSGMSSVRLDNYVYTVESFRAARERLAPDGRLVTYHMSHEPYIAAKINAMITEAFGQAPLVFYDEPWMLFNYTFVAGGPPSETGALTPIRDVGPVELPHDDWPYLYLRKRTIPSHYLLVLAGVALTALLFIGLATPRSTWRQPEGAMFFFGAGFLLLETKSVTEMSLLFGSTWNVNLLVFSSILTCILLANLIVHRYSPPVWRCFAGLFASLAVAYLVPVSALLFAGRTLQWVLGGVLVALPILFAGMIFASLLKQKVNAVHALAFNLLGAILGGILEYFSMIGGTKSLYLIAAGIYALAFLAERRSRAATVGGGGATSAAVLEAA
ncbi:MAG TPA: hypothetical protein VFZ73_09185 [Gemmatimonadaceae bacterium]